MPQIVSIGRLMNGRRGGVFNGIAPVLDFNFASQQAILATALPSGISLSRAGTRNIWNSAGVLASITNNVPAYEWGWYPTSAAMEAQGLLWEPSKQNQLLQSNHLNTTWNNFGGGTLSTGEADPLGGTNGFGFISGARCQQGSDLALAAGKWVGSCLIKGTDTSLPQGVTANMYCNTSADQIQASCRVDTTVPWGMCSVQSGTSWANYAVATQKKGLFGWLQLDISGDTTTAAKTVNIFLLRFDWNTSTKKVLCYQANLTPGLYSVNPIDSTVGKVTSVADALTITGGTGAAGFSTTRGAFRFLHDARSNARLLSCNGASLVDAASTVTTDLPMGFTVPSKRETLWIYGPSGQEVWENGAMVSSSGSAPTFGASDLTLGGTDPLHFQQVSWYAEGLA